MKKLLVILATVVLLVAMLALPASALTSGDWEYTIQNNEIFLTKYIGSGGDVEVPSTLNGVPVTKINFGCFTNNKNAGTIRVPSSVKEIEKMSFQGCTATEIYIEDGCTVIGDKAFRGNDALESLRLPATVQELGYELIEYCPNLTELFIPEGITELPERMCRSCTSLSSVKLPSTLKVIGTYAFGECGLESIDIPANVTEIGGHAFASCRALEEVNFLGSNITYIGGRAFKDCAMETIYLPTSITELDSEVFLNCDNLTGVVLPYGIKSIGNAVFDECDNLTWVSAPSTLTSIFANNFGYSPNMIVYTPAGSASETACLRWETPFLTDASADAQIPVIYNGQRISFAAYGQNPEIINSRTMVPLRSIFEAMGADITWDGETRTAHAVRGSTTISMTIGSSTFYVNGEARTLDTPACIINNRTMVPIRAIAESFSADVSWNGPARTAIISE